LSTGLSKGVFPKARALAWWDSAQVEGTFFGDFLKKLESSAAERILQAARESLILGEPLRETGKRLQEALNTSGRSALRMLRNATHSAANWAEREVYRENLDRFKGFRFQAELDRHTCDYCASLDGDQFALEDAPAPPVHYGCRCWIYPVMKDVIVDGETVPFEDAIGPEYNEVSRRISRLETAPYTVHHRDGTTSTAYQGYNVKFVDRKMNYRQWMESMVKSSESGDRAFAKEALGPTRFEMVKKGKLKVESLYYQGKLRNIDDLKRLMES
jgi:SPP1 gp7 family putative phage head morphogenesis protein